MDDTTEIESNAIIDTEDYTEEDDEPEEEIYKMTAIDFVVANAIAMSRWHMKGECVCFACI